MGDLFEYKCPCCGGTVQFDSGIQKLKCYHCDTELELDALKSLEETIENESDKDDLHWDKSFGSEWKADEQRGMTSYICKSCGGEIISEATTSASSCPYCGNVIVMRGNLEGALRPDFVIPFKKNKEDAINAYKGFIKGKRLLPKNFKANNQIEKIKGIYVPFWFFDCEANANIRYKATRVRNWSDSKYHYTETSHYMIAREGKISFERVPVDGSTKMPDELMESIEPFDHREAVDFQTAYLAGYLADKYDVDADTSILRANQRIHNSTEDAFRNTVKGYSMCTPEQSSIRTAKGCIHYGLMPVWVLNTRYKEQFYTFAMNGQTGKMIGNLPLDRGAYWRWFFGVFAGTAAALLATMLFI